MRSGALISQLYCASMLALGRSRLRHPSCHVTIPQSIHTTMQSLIPSNSGKSSIPSQVNLSIVPPCPSTAHTKASNVSLRNRVVYLAPDVHERRTVSPSSRSLHSPYPPSKSLNTPAAPGQSDRGPFCRDGENVPCSYVPTGMNILPGLFSWGIRHGK